MNNTIIIIIHLLREAIALFDHPSLVKFIQRFLILLLFALNPLELCWVDGLCLLLGVRLDVLFQKHVCGGGEIEEQINNKKE